MAFIAVLLGACAGPTQAVAPVDQEPHYSDDWYVFRAEQLGIEVDAARARDAALPVDAPPELDASTAVEAAALWRELCAKCHGADGRGVEGATYDPPPKKWGGFGVRMGFFFGGDSMRSGIYRRIAEGGDSAEKPSAMPAFGSTLSREQIWALVKHIEGF